MVLLSVAITGKSITVMFGENSSNCSELKDANPREDQFTDGKSIIE